MNFKGSELHRDDQRHVLAAYVHRFTGDHRPFWVKPCNPLQFKNDSEWLENTTFQVKKNGRLDMRVHHCFSMPTWPNNPELRK